jgi:hypothetical protein
VSTVVFSPCDVHRVFVRFRISAKRKNGLLLSLDVFPTNVHRGISSTGSQLQLPSFDFLKKSETKTMLMLLLPELRNKPAKQTYSFGPGVLPFTTSTSTEFQGRVCPPATPRFPSHPDEFGYLTLSGKFGERKRNEREEEKGFLATFYSEATVLGTRCAPRKHQHTE